jgi:FAD synthetase
MKAIAFNGGKESLIVLHKNLKALQNSKIKLFRILDKDEFPEIEEYVQKILKMYSLEILEFSDMKESINKLKDIYNVNTVILGNRRTDPNSSHLNTYTETDDNWPKIVRYFPLLNWSYKNVWNYIVSHKLPVCSLYEKGYTSIGNIKNTFPNYYLFQDNKFLHAKYLEDESLEREGRIKTKLPITFSGKVIKGKGMGKKLGFPTANLDTVLDIDEGIYYGTCIKNGQEEYMVMSVGYNPMFKDKSIEIHILQNYDTDFYNEILNINVKGFIRKMKFYPSLDILIQAIQKDIHYLKNLYGK